MRGVTMLPLGGVRRPTVRHVSNHPQIYELSEFLTNFDDSNISRILASQRVEIRRGKSVLSSGSVTNHEIRF